MHETTAHPLSIHTPELIYQDRYQQLFRVVAEFPGFSKEYIVSERGERAAILVVRNDEVLLARQYRLLVNDVALEIPGGAVDKGEDPAVAAVRECREETGVQAHDPRVLICYHPSLDTMRNYTHIYVAQECTDVADVDPDRRTWLPLSRCLEMIFTQQLPDVLTIVAILAYDARRRVCNDPL